MLHIALQLWPSRLTAAASTLIYLSVAATLIIMSFAGPWPYPALLPLAFSSHAWAALTATPTPLLTSLGLAIAASLTAVSLATLWFETIDERFDRWLIAAALLALAAPPVLIASGQYQAFLQAGLTASWTGLFLAHLTPALAYVLIVLQGPTRDFDPRIRAAAMSLQATPLRFWLTIKAPILKPSLAAAAATAFAVSFAQFVPAQLIAAGRFSTLPMEAVTLASGGNRPLMAAFALALALPPALVFAAAAAAGRPRWSR